MIKTRRFRLQNTILEGGPQMPRAIIDDVHARVAHSGPMRRRDATRVFNSKARYVCVRYDHCLAKLLVFALPSQGRQLTD